jgi:hypothetical protein
MFKRSCECYTRGEKSPNDHVDHRTPYLRDVQWFFIIWGNRPRNKDFFVFWSCQPKESISSRLNVSSENVPAISDFTNRMCRSKWQVKSSQHRYHVITDEDCVRNFLALLLQRIRVAYDFAAFGISRCDVCRIFFHRESLSVLLKSHRICFWNDSIFEILNHLINTPDLWTIFEMTIAVVCKTLRWRPQDGRSFSRHPVLDLNVESALVPLLLEAFRHGQMLILKYRLRIVRKNTISSQTRAEFTPLSGRLPLPFNATIPFHRRGPIWLFWKLLWNGTS